MNDAISGNFSLTKPILLLLDEPVVRMALRNRSQFRFPEQLPEVLPLVEPHAIRQRNDVLREIAIDRLDLAEQAIGMSQHLFEPERSPAWSISDGNVVTVKGREALALLRHHPMTMQIAVRSDVHDNFESQISIFERAAHLLPARGSFRQISSEQILSLGSFKRLAFSIA